MRSKGSVVEGVVADGDGGEDGPSTWTHAKVFPVNPGESGGEICLGRDGMLGMAGRGGKRGKEAWKGWSGGMSRRKKRGKE